MQPYRIDPEAWKKIEVRDFENEPAPYGAGLAKGIAMQVRRLDYDRDELETTLANRIRQLNFLIERNKSFLGRLQNRVTKAETERIELDGMVLQQLLECVGADPMPKIRMQYIYNVPHKTVREWYALAFPHGARLEDPSTT